MALALRPVHNISFFLPVSSSRADSQAEESSAHKAQPPGGRHSGLVFFTLLLVSRCGGAASARLLRACWPVSRCCMWLGNHVTTTLGSSCTALGFLLHDHLAVPLCHTCYQSFPPDWFLPALRGVHPSNDTFKLLHALKKHADMPVVQVMPCNRQGITPHAHGVSNMHLTGAARSTAAKCTVMPPSYTQCHTTVQYVTISGAHTQTDKGAMYRGRNSYNQHQEQHVAALVVMMVQPSTPLQLTLGYKPAVRQHNNGSAIQIQWDLGKHTATSNLSHVHNT
jgi:hypothetical protein